MTTGMYIQLIGRALRPMGYYQMDDTSKKYVLALLAEIDKLTIERAASLIPAYLALDIHMKKLESVGDNKRTTLSDKVADYNQDAFGYSLASKVKAYEAGVLARANNAPIEFNTGFGYRNGKYYDWYKAGWSGEQFNSEFVAVYDSAFAKGASLDLNS